MCEQEALAGGGATVILPWKPVCIDWQGHAWPLGNLLWASAEPLKNRVATSFDHTAMQFLELSTVPNNSALSIRLNGFRQDIPEFHYLLKLQAFGHWKKIFICNAMV